MNFTDIHVFILYLYCIVPITRNIRMRFYFLNFKQFYNEGKKLLKMR